MLNRNWLVIDDAKAEKTMGAGVIAQAIGILGKRRGSDWSKDKRLEATGPTFVANSIIHPTGSNRLIPKDANSS